VYKKGLYFFLYTSPKISVVICCVTEIQPIFSPAIIDNDIKIVHMFVLWGWGIQSMSFLIEKLCGCQFFWMAELMSFIDNDYNFPCTELSKGACSPSFLGIASLSEIFWGLKWVTLGNTGMKWNQLFLSET